MGYIADASVSMGRHAGSNNTQSTQKEKSSYSARAFLSAHANWSGQEVGLGPH